MTLRETLRARLTDEAVREADQAAGRATCDVPDDDFERIWHETYTAALLDALAPVEAETPHPPESSTGDVR